MKEINIRLGASLDEAIEEMQKQKPCYADFNNEIITSNETVDEIYMKVVGLTKAAFELRRKSYWNDK
jgi:hypothetical protein